MPSSVKYKTHGVFAHFLAILFTLVGVLGIFLVIFYNAPLPSNDDLKASQAAQRWWLVTITDDLAPRVDLPVVHGKPTNVDTPSISTGVFPAIRVGEASSDSGNKARDLSDAKIDGRLEYGFGVFGWCEWHKGDYLGNGLCHSEIFWRLPQDASPDDRVVTLKLPGSLRKSLSIASSFLIFPAITGVLLLFGLLIALASPPRAIIDAKTSTEGMSGSTRVHYYIVHRGASASYAFWAIIWWLPTLIVCVVARDKVNDEKPLGLSILHSRLGAGFWLLLGSILFIVTAALTSAWGGLTVRLRVKG